jgi:protein O-mannosyl-transferase
MGIGRFNNEGGLTECRINSFAFYALAIVILVIYSNTFQSPFHFDDISNIEERSSIHLKELSWSNIKQIIYNEEAGNLYRPVACLTLAANYYFGEMNVFGYHLVNISIHIIASFFLFLLIYQILNLPSFKSKYAEDAYFIALLSAALWATHPLQTQAVTYIVQRMASLAGMFYVISMYFYVKGRLCQKNHQKYFLFTGCLIAGLLSFGSKENAAVLPLSLFLLELFLLQGLSKKKVFRALIVLFIIVLIMPILAFILKGSQLFDPAYYSQSYEIRNFTLLERVLTQPRVLLFYISLLFYPMPYRLCLSHDIPISYSLLDPLSTLFSILALISIIIIGLIFANKYPLIAFCILFFFINHLVESTIFSLELIFEHRNYIPSMLFFLPICIILRNLIAYYTKKQYFQIILISFIVLLLVAQGHGTYIRNAVWKTEESLWIDVVEKYPNQARGHHNLAGYYYDRGQKDKAIMAYERSLELPDPSFGNRRHITHANLGNIYLSLGNDEKAIQHFASAISETPADYLYLSPYNELGVIMLRQGRYQEAAEHFSTVLEHSSSNPKTHYNLGLVFMETNRFEDAIRQFNKALELDNSHLPSLHYLGITYKSMGHYSKAVQSFKKLLIHNPKAFLTRMHLAETYLLVGERDMGKDHIHKALSDTPPRILLSEFHSPSTGGSQKAIPSLDIVLEYIKEYYCMDVLSTLR